MRTLALDLGAVLEPGADGPGSVPGHVEGVDRGRVEHVDLVPGPRERDVEHALDVRGVHLASREGGPGHDVVVPRERVEDDVALVALEAVGVDHDEVVLLPLLGIDGGGDHLVDECHLLFEQAQHPDGGAVVVGVGDHVGQVLDEHLGLELVLLLAARDPALFDVVELDDRLVGGAERLVGDVGHDAEPPAVPAVVGELDDGRQAAEVLVEDAVLLGLGGDQGEQRLVHGVEVPRRVEGGHAELLPGREGDAAAHEGEALGLHLLGVAEDHELLGPICHGDQGGQVDLGGLVDDDHVEELVGAREQAGHVVGREDPHRQDPQELAGVVEVLLHLVEQGEVLVRGLVPLQRRLEVLDHLALAAVGPGDLALEPDLEDVERMVEELGPARRRPLGHLVGRLGGRATRPPHRRAHLTPGSDSPQSLGQCQLAVGQLDLRLRAERGGVALGIGDLLSRRLLERGGQRLVVRVDLVGRPALLDPLESVEQLAL